nr:hypothetical protein [Pantoea sp. 201603H]
MLVLNSNVINKRKRNTIACLVSLALSGGAVAADLPYTVNDGEYTFLSDSDAGEAAVLTFFGEDVKAINNAFSLKGGSAISNELGFDPGTGEVTVGRIGVINNNKSGHLMGTDSGIYNGAVIDTINNDGVIIGELSGINSLGDTITFLSDKSTPTIHHINNNGVIRGNKHYGI